MVKTIEVRRQVSVAGRVTDTVSRKPLAGAVVSIVDMPAILRERIRTKSIQYGRRWDAMAERPDRTRTAPDGLFYFMDLPDGKYTFAVSLAQSGKRYGATRAGAVVSEDAKGNAKLSFLDIGLPPTAVQGKVTGTGHKAGLVMAEVRVKGSGERAFSDAQGDYVLAGVEPGKRTILVTAKGYRLAAKPVTIEQPGDQATLNFSLAREAAG